LRYIAIFPYSTNPSIEHVVDLSQPDRSGFEYAVELIKRVGHAYASDYECLLEAQFERTDNGFIKSPPKRLTVEKAIALLNSAFAGRRRGKDRKQRVVLGQSLKNLRQHQSHRIGE
jgi:hypothetical protein